MAGAVGTRGRRRRGGHFSGGGHAAGGHASGGHFGGGAHGAPAGHSAATLTLLLPAGLAATAAQATPTAIPGLSRRCGVARRYYGHGGGGGYYYGHGYSTGAYWRGGYWHGGFWPRAYYGLGFSWFLPILPLAYATYWYGGIPYYYANDVYYTYNPSYDGYVATDPPPVADSGAGAEGAAPGSEAGVRTVGRRRDAARRVRYSCTRGTARAPSSRPPTKPNASNGLRSRPDRWRRTARTICARWRPASKGGATAGVGRFVDGSAARVGDAPLAGSGAGEIEAPDIAFEVARIHVVSDVIAIQIGGRGVGNAVAAAGAGGCWRARTRTGTQVVERDGSRGVD